MVQIIYGSKGTGKTSYMLDIIKRSRRCCVAIDTIIDCEPGTSVSRFEKYMERVYNPCAVDLCTLRFFKQVYTPITDQHFLKYCAFLFKYRNLNIFIDEIDNWSTAQRLPVELYNLFRYSRHRNYNIYATCRVPMEIHNRLRGSVDQMIVHKLIEYRHLEYFEYHWPGISDRIRNLSVGKYITIQT